MQPTPLLQQPDSSRRWFFSFRSGDGSFSDGDGFISARDRSLFLASKPRGSGNGSFFPASKPRRRGDGLFHSAAESLDRRLARSAPSTFRAECCARRFPRPWASRRPASRTFPAEGVRAGLRPFGREGGRPVAHSPRNAARSFPRLAPSPRNVARSFVSSRIPRGMLLTGFRALRILRGMLPAIFRSSRIPRGMLLAALRAAGHARRSLPAYAHDPRTQRRRSSTPVLSIRMSHESQRTCRFRLTDFSSPPDRASWTIVRQGSGRAEPATFVAEIGCCASLVDFSRPSATCGRRARKMSW
jgi:hypothetical protein